MKKQTIFFKILCSLMLFAVIFSSCKKTDEWLDAKIRLNDVRPTTIEDFQAILNSENVLNASYTGIGLQGADNYYLSDENYNASSQFDRDLYLWKRNSNSDDLYNDWFSYYQAIEQTNIVIDGLKTIDRENSNSTEYDRTRGSATFFRAYYYYGLVQLYCKPYNKSTSRNDLGVVIRQSSDVNEKSSRSTVEETYDYIISDLKTSIELLPVITVFQTQPTRAAALALLAKLYLNMEEYELAYQYADATLKINNTLIDFNDTKYAMMNSPFPFPDFQKNPEILFWARSYARLPILPGYGVGFINKALYDSYDQDDLRKQAFYFLVGNDNHCFRGTYYGTLENASFSYLFSGIANNELYLIKAECAARLGKSGLGLDDLNALLVKRYLSGKFSPYSTLDQEVALNTILKERRKELPFSSQVTWEDLRRLNRDPKFARSLTRVIGGTIYTLPPNDPGYTLPIPEREIQLSGIEQNEK